MVRYQTLYIYDIWMCEQILDFVFEVVESHNITFSAKKDT